MRLVSHRMCGFNHFEEPFVLDLLGLPQGLVAIVGGNGMGKTSLGLEGPFAALYGPTEPGKPAFPSRDGKLADYATSRQAYIDDTWTLDGVGTFRIRVNVDGQRRVTEASIEEVLADGRRVSLNPDGKSVTYREEVLKRFPSRTSLLASAFASQNRRGSFGDLTQPERIALFRELADLQHLEDKAQTAKQCAQVADGIAARIGSALEVIRRDASPEQAEALARTVAQIGLEIGTAQADRRAAVNRLTKSEADRVRWQTEAQRHAVALEKADGARQALARAEAEVRLLDLAAPAMEHADELRRVTARLTAAVQSIVARRTQVVAAHRKGKAERNQRIAEQQDLLHDGELIRGAVARAQQAEQRIAALRKDEQVQRADLESAREQVRARQSGLATAETAARDLELVRKRAELLVTVKFGDECGVEPACPLVTDAVTARARIPDLEGQAQHAPSLRDGIAHWTQKAAEHEVALRESSSSLVKAERDLQASAADAKRAPHLDAAEARIAEYRSDQQQADDTHATALAGLDAETTQAGTQHQQETQVADARLDEQRAALDVKLAALSLAVAQAQEAVASADREAASSADAARQLTEAETTLKAVQQEIADLDRTTARLEAEQEAVRRQQADLAAKQAQADETARRLRTVEDELLAWQTLAKALGRDGIQKLELDHAGPVVSDIANTLLQVGYGTRFSINFVTQVATADKKEMKERFTCEISDEEHGGEPRDLADLSGGERVVIEECIRAALATYVNLRSRTRVKTLFRDETTGALSPDNGPRYIALLRKMLELSGATQCLFVTHNEDLAMLADAIVHVENGCVKSIQRAA